MSAAEGFVEDAAAIAPRRLLLLAALFFLVCCGLGYPSLNRVDWRNAPGGLEDARTYAEMVEGTLKPYPGDHMQYRVLVPGLARSIYRAARGHTGSWDPAMLGLLVVNAALVAATAMLLVGLTLRAGGSYAMAVGAAFLYLVNFAVPNLRLSGFIDAGEAFFLMAGAWTLSRGRYWLLPVLAAVGSTAKESCVCLLVAFALGWWVAARSDRRERLRQMGWLAASGLAGLAAIALVQWRVDGAYRSPLRFGLELHQNSDYVSHLLGSFADRNLWYIFAWLLPLSLVRLRRLPGPWRWGTGCAALAAFAMDAYYGGPRGAIGRALFTVAGPLLSAAAAMLVFEAPAVANAGTGRRRHGRA